MSPNEIQGRLALITGASGGYVGYSTLEYSNTPTLLTSAHLALEQLAHTSLPNMESILR